MATVLAAVQRISLAFEFSFPHGIPRKCCGSTVRDSTDTVCRGSAARTCSIRTHAYLREQNSYSAGDLNSKCPPSQDLTLLRIVYQRIGMGCTYEEIAKNLNIAASTKHRIFKQFELSGDLAAPTDARQPRPYTRTLDQHSELVVIGLILQSPTLYLHEICQTIQEVTSLSVSQATICRLLHRYGFTRKKVKQVALQRCFTLRGAFMAYCSLFSRYNFIWDGLKH